MLSTIWLFFFNFYNNFNNNYGDDNDFFLYRPRNLAIRNGRLSMLSRSADKDD